jgi:hypothetical protein
VVVRRPARVRSVSGVHHQLGRAPGRERRDRARDPAGVAAARSAPGPRNRSVVRTSGPSEPCESRLQAVIAAETRNRPRGGAGVVAPAPGPRAADPADPVLLRDLPDDSCDRRERVQVAVAVEVVDRRRRRASPARPVRRARPAPPRPENGRRALSGAPARAGGAARPRRRATGSARAGGPVRSSCRHRCTPTPRRGRLASPAIASSNAAPVASRLALVTIPPSCPAKIARLMPADMPRSSAFTIKRAGGRSATGSAEPNRRSGPGSSPPRTRAEILHGRALARGPLTRLRRRRSHGFSWPLRVFGRSR